MFSRRVVMGGLAATAMVTPALADADEMITPGMITGPFYPDRLPDDQDWDLLRNGGLESGATPLIVEGVVRGVFGPPARPVRNATVELWQCDSHGRYLHSGDATPTPRDVGFQGYGVVRTDADGRYRFRTLKPPSYTADAGPYGIITRAPHIHMAVTTGGVRRLTTQLFFANEPLNDQDVELARIPELDRKAALMTTLQDGVARFDMIVLL
jgi:protocatechuate 3,4-dioxygenase beta subunit